MKVGLFGGSFDPVHNEHVSLARAAIQTLGLDKLVVIPSRIAPHKLAGSIAEGKNRLEMCKIAFRDIEIAEISPYETDRAETSYSYLTCAHFRALYPSAQLYFLVGADMLENFPTWRNPQEILRTVTLAACGRAEADVKEYAEEVKRLFGKEVVLIPYIGKEVSSTRLRVELAFGKRPEELDGEVFNYIRKAGLYSHPAILPALALEKEERREHSFRVACLASEYAPKCGVSKEKAILAAALHDCGKYVKEGSPLLAGFVPPAGVPAPVLHQFTGAYLAEHVFGIEDGEVLDAIRYHTSGRENMTPLGKLIFVADMLEEGRNFEGIEELRLALSRSLDEGFLACISAQTEHLQAQNKPVYPLTEQAYRWAISHK